MATQPVLQGTTLPWPKADGGYEESYAMRAVSVETANGNLVFQRITTSAKREFTLSWQAITNGDRGNILAAYDALLSTGGTNNFTSIHGNTYTVTPLPNNPPIVGEFLNTPGGGKYNVTIKLREVSST